MVMMMRKAESPDTTNCKNNASSFHIIVLRRHEKYIANVIQRYMEQVNTWKQHAEMIENIQVGEQ